MLGQGRPIPLTTFGTAARTNAGRAWTAALWLILVCATSIANAQEVKLRIRVEWGGGAARQRVGRISVDQGSISEPRLLGIEADEPGSMWVKEGQLHIAERSPRVYDGLDLVVTSPLEAELIVELAEKEDWTRVPKKIPLRELVNEYHNHQIDTQGNRLLIRRSPGDRLRVELDRDATIYMPGEKMQFTLQPYLLNVPVGTKVHLESKLVPARGTKELWTSTNEVTASNETAGFEPRALSVPLPEQEGVYDLVLSASRRGLPNRLGWKQTLDERRVQVVVLSNKAPQNSVQTPTTSTMEQIVEIDPANPVWWERLTNIPLLPGLRKGPLGNGNAASWQHPLGTMVQLGPGGREPNISWEAYPLPVNRPGEAHILEVDFPSDVAQALGFSLLEPNAAGALTPIGLDSGVYVSAEAADRSPHIARHRLVCWPRTKTPLLLVTNGRDGARAVYSKIRLLGPRSSHLSTLMRDSAQPSRLPRAFPPGSSAERLLAGYYDRPLFPENFSASESLDSWSGRSLDDWTTFYEGGIRLVEYLNYVGYNGLMLTVLADGSAIYPSRLLDPTPQYDTGAFFSSGQDPLRKDILEMLLRLFDRDGMKLIPAVQFSSPLPELERINGPERVGIELVGVEGQTWLAKNPPRNGAAPYYNPLDERVQRAMLAVIRELVERYGHHPSFGGLAVQLSADGYAQLPGEEWGVDERTLSRFQKETGVTLPASSDRAATLLKLHRSRWREWRTRSLAQFHERMQAEAAAVDPAFKLYLAAAHSLETPESERGLRPALPRTSSVDEVMRNVGLDPQHYAQSPQVVFLRPQRLAPLNSLWAQAVNLELNQASDLDRTTRNESNSAALFYHEPQVARMKSFDDQSPFKSSYTRLIAQPSPAGIQNRRRFLHALASLDAREIFDGGWLLPLGQEEELRNLVAVFRRLPAGAFETMPGQTQPVTVRTLRRDNRTFMYLVNESPWKASLTLMVSARDGCRVESLNTALRNLPNDFSRQPRSWTIELGPYDLVGVSFDDPHVQLSGPRVALERGASNELALKIQDLWSRAGALQNPAPWDTIQNAGFEQPLDASGQIAGWQASESGAAHGKVESRQPHQGKACLRLSNENGPAFLVSRPFDAPATGRISVAVWLRVEDVTRQPSMRLSIEGKLAGQDYYRYAPVGNGKDVEKIGVEWSQFVFQVHDLPAEGLTDLRVRFDLTEDGAVWIDDVQLFDLVFSSNERLELSKTITLAEFKLQRGEVADCLRVLEGYWPRFLVSNVPLTEIPLASRPKTTRAPAPVVAPAETEKKPGMMDRVKRMLPDFLR